MPMHGHVNILVQLKVDTAFHNSLLRPTDTNIYTD